MLPHAGRMRERFLYDLFLLSGDEPREPDEDAGAHHRQDEAADPAAADAQKEGRGSFS